MGRLPHRSLSSALTATVLTAVAIAQPVLFLKQAAFAQAADPAREIEFIPQDGDANLPQDSSQVITAPQGSFGRGGQAAVPPSPPVTPSSPAVPPTATNPAADTPLATSTVSSGRSIPSEQSVTSPSDSGSGGAALPGAPSADADPASVVGAPVPTAPTLSQAAPPPAPAIPQAPAAVPPLGASAPYNYSSPDSAADSTVANSAASGQANSEALPTIPIPSQPVTPQSAPNTTAAPPSQPDIPTSYDYRRPTDNRPSTPTFVANGQLPEGTVIPVATFRDTKFTQGQQVQVNLSVTQDVTDSQGRTIVPAGSTVWGRFEPIMEESTEMVGNFERTRKRVVGSQFIAERIDIQSASHAISGRTNRIPAGIDPDADVDRVALRNAGFGVLGGVALGVLTGGAGFLPLMAIGGASGAMAGAVSVSNVVAINGDTVLEITLDQPFISS
ncbi:MAG: hypothetical protein AAGM36_01320 [Cyanobacteria bacterium J06597_1]